MKLNNKDKALQDDLENWFISCTKGKTEKVIKELDRAIQSIMGTLKTVPNKPGKASAARIQALFKKLERKIELQ